MVSSFKSPYPEPPQRAAAGGTAPITSAFRPHTKATPAAVFQALGGTFRVPRFAQTAWKAERAHLSEFWQRIAGCRFYVSLRLDGRIYLKAPRVLCLFLARLPHRQLTAYFPDVSTEPPIPFRGRHLWSRWMRRHSSRPCHSRTSRHGQPRPLAARLLRLPWRGGRATASTSSRSDRR